MFLYAATILLSAFQLFLVQPIIAKQILPWFGGGAAVWTTCMLFFQIVLLAGYAYAHWLAGRVGRPQRRAALVHMALLLLSLIFIPIIPAASWRPDAAADPLWHILGLLVATIGLPYFLLAATGPLLQKWFSHSYPSGTVYRLFALSNFGSLAGLLAYPFLIEPFVGSTVQSWVWSAAYVLFVCACAATAWRVYKGTATPAGAAVEPAAVVQEIPDDAIGYIPAEAAPPAAPPHAPGWRDLTFWLFCSALGSVLLLALTSHLTQNIASIPFLWVLPLALYLLSFVVCFEGRGGQGWYRRGPWLLPVLGMAMVMAYGLSAHRGVLALEMAVPLYSVGLFVACVFCHGELARSKPAPAWLTHFYLALSCGGALGGVLVALLAPHLFNNYWETPLALIALALLALVLVVRDMNRHLGHVLAALVLAGIVSILVLSASGDFTWIHWPSAINTDPVRAGNREKLQIALALLLALAAMRLRITAAIALAALFCTSYYGWKYYDYLARDTLVMSRDFYGTLRVRQSAAGPNQTRRLLHGVILHGEQFTDPARQRTPSTYYGPTSGVGLALLNLRPDHGSQHVPLRVGLVGMGTGTLTAYGQPGDVYRIYEIDPAVQRIARSSFHYLNDSRASIEVLPGDARLSMERELAAGKFAAAEERYDILAIDAFSSDAIPVHLLTREALAAYARMLKPDGVIAFHVSNRFLDLAPVVQQLADDAGFAALLIEDDPDDDVTWSHTDWVLVTHNKHFLESEEITEEGNEIKPQAGLRLWTDQFNNLFQILK